MANISVKKEILQLKKGETYVHSLVDSNAVYMILSTRKFMWEKFAQKKIVWITKTMLIWI